MGKTALLWAYMHQEFRDVYQPTVVDSYQVKLMFQTRQLKLEVFDTAGQEEFDEIRRANFDGSDGKITWLLLI